VPILRVIAGAFGWWSRHPWTVFWVALLIFPGVALALVVIVGPRVPSAWLLTTWWELLVMAWWSVAIVIMFSIPVSFVMGLVRSFRASPVRALLITVLLALVLAILIPLYANVGSRARIAKADADVRALAKATSMYRDHMGRLPATLDELTRRATNSRAEAAGPFIDALPSPPAGYEPYRFEPRPDGTFTISSKGDHTARAP
jgi:hypothetical protein